MRHLFARCYCLHGGDFIRCCDNFINLGEIKLSFPEKEKMERQEWWGGGGLQSETLLALGWGRNTSPRNYFGTIDTAEPFSSILMRYARLMLPAVLGCR